MITCLIVLALLTLLVATEPGPGEPGLPPRYSRKSAHGESKACE